jgi:beta-galactosidase/beta-glucuronidase
MWHSKAAVSEQGSLELAIPSGPSSIDLSGDWRFRLDREDIGIQQRWFVDVLSDKVRLPGSIQEQGFGAMK